MSQRPSFFLRSILFCLCCVLLCPLTIASGALAAGSARTSFSLSRFHASRFTGQALAAPKSHAQQSGSSPITITSETYSLHFPTSIDFTLSARDTQSAINTARLSIQFEDAASTPNAEQYAVRIDFPARVITLHYHENTAGDNFHYPGTPVQYSWALQDQANNQQTAAGGNFTTLDTRFSWQHLSQGLLNVYWYNRPADFGQTLLTRAQAGLSHDSQVLGGGLRHAISVWVYANDTDFHGALAPGSYEWIGGEAHPDLNEAFISAVDSEDTTLVRDLPHELSHLVLHQLVAQSMGDYVPKWFDEGMAVYNQFYHEPEMTFRFKQALASQSLLRIDDISAQFPADGNTAFLAYAQSWNLVAYMYATFGQAKMTLLIQEMDNAQNNFNTDLTQALGEDQLHLENAWRLSLHQPPVLAADQQTLKPVVHITLPQTMLVDNTDPLLIALGSALIVLPILAVAALLIYQRRRRQQARAAQNERQSMAPPAQVAQYPPPPNRPRQYPPPPAQYMPFAPGPSANPYEWPTTGEIPRLAQQQPAAPWPPRFEYPGGHFQPLADAEPAAGATSQEKRDASQM